MNLPLSRRQMLRHSATGLLAAGMWPGVLRAGDPAPGDDFHFLVINDLHYRDQRCGPWFERVVRQIKRHAEKIDFCLLAGDLADQGKPEQFGPVRDLFQPLGMPIHVVIGNHDYRAVADRKPFEEAFPRSLNYRFEHRGWQFVMLDSSEGTKVKTAVQPSALHWLDEALPQLDRRRPTVLCSHFPFGPLVIYRVSNADQVLARFKEHNLRAVFNGHFHGFSERRLGKTTLTTNRCCSFSRPNHDGTKEKGYFLCHARDGEVQRTFVEVPPA